MKEFAQITELFNEREWLRQGTKFYHEQVFNNGKAYIYAVGYNKGERLWFEVFKRKVVPNITNVNGKIVRLEDKGHVAYPCDNDFGKWARNCTTFEQAMQYAKEWS